MKNDFKSASLAVYRLAYKAAVEVHQFIQKKDCRLADDQAQELKIMSRYILQLISDMSFADTGRERRRLCILARESGQKMVLGLAFLHDVKKISGKFFESANGNYELINKQLWKIKMDLMPKSKVK